LKRKGLASPCTDHAIAQAEEKAVGRRAGGCVICGCASRRTRLVRRRRYVMQEGVRRT